MKKYILITIIAALLTGGCDFFIAPGSGGDGNLTILVGNGGRAALPAEITDQFRYEFEFSGPDQFFTRTLAPGVPLLSVSAAPGEWTIAAQAYASNGALAGTGSAAVTVSAGQNTARIPMIVHDGYIEIPPDGAVIPIGSAAELAGIIDHITDPAKNYGANAYVLTADIDLSGFGPWTPIGKVITDADVYGTPATSEPFTGNFYGQGHSIRGLELPGGSVKKIGLFGYAVDARIQDLVVELAPVSISVSAPSGSVSVGGTLGRGDNTHIVNCGVYSSGTITITGTVGYDLAIGGIVSAIASGAVRGSYASLNLAATNTGTHLDIYGITNGGLSNTVDCYFAGSITGSGNNVRIGGVGMNVDTEGCYAAGTLSNTNNNAGYTGTGGIYVGSSNSAANSAALQSAITHTNNTRYGRVHAYESAGTPTFDLTNNYAYSGMLVNGESVTDDATDPEHSQNGLGKSASELKQQSTWQNGLGWDFDNVWEMGPPAYPFPILKWQNGVVHIPSGFTVIN
jgi:hypothetical protein